MEILSTTFLMALLTIIVIDLVLAGDNALVIGLAARNVPADMQKRVILWGTAGAIAIRIAFTLGIVWLLKILLVVLGLLISVPIMVWGSTLVLKWVDRFPQIITIGCGVLIWTATQMILDEKLLTPYLPTHTWFDELSGAILTIAILGAFIWRQRQKRVISSVAPRLLPSSQEK